MLDSCWLFHPVGSFHAYVYIRQHPCSFVFSQVQTRRRDCNAVVMGIKCNISCITFALFRCKSLVYGILCTEPDFAIMTLR